MITSKRSDYWHRKAILAIIAGNSLKTISNVMGCSYDEIAEVYDAYTKEFKKTRDTFFGYKNAPYNTEKEMLKDSFDKYEYSKLSKEEKVIYNAGPCYSNPAKNYEVCRKE